MNHKDFLIELQKSCHIDHQQCATLFSSLLKLMVQAAIDQIPLSFFELGTFSSHKHPEYIQENPITGEQTLFPPRISYRFQADNDNLLTEEGNQSLIEQLSKYAHQPIDVTSSFILHFAHIIKTHLLNREDVCIHGLGQFQIVEAHQSQLHRIAFTPDEQMREQVNAPFNCFEPVIIREGVEPNPTKSGADEESIIEQLPEVTASDSTKDVQDEISITEIQDTLEDNVHEDTINHVEDKEVEDTTDSVGINSVEDNVVEEKTNYIKDINDEETTSSDVVERELLSSNPTNKEVIKERHPNKKLFYTSICIILLACVSLLYYMFQNSNEVEFVEAEIVNVETSNNNVAKSEEPQMTLTVDSGSICIQPNVQDTIEQPLIAEQEKPSPKIEVQKTKTEEVKKENVDIRQTPIEKKPETIPSKPKEFHRLIGEDGQPVMVTLNPGERLTIISLNQFGDKAFWPYIFEVNSDRLKAPNLVQAGMKLYLPDPTFYDIDANNDASLRKAKNKGAQLLK